MVGLAFIDFEFPLEKQKLITSLSDLVLEGFPLNMLFPSMCNQ